MSGKKIKVLHAITRLDRGGSAENTLLTVSQANMDRYEVSLVTGPTEDERSSTEILARARGVHMAAAPHLVRNVSPFADLRAVWELWRLMRQGRFHIVHTHTSKAGLLGRLAARLAGVPIVIHTPHGHVFYGYFGPVVTRLFVWLERWAAGFSQRVISLTEKGAQDHVDFAIAAREKFAVIHSGINFPSFDPDGPSPQAVRAELGIPAEGMVFGTLGRLTAIKGQEDLIEAFAVVRERVDNAWLLLVGDGEEREALIAQAARLGVMDRMVLAGWRQDVYAVLAAMDIFALPSLNEGMGKALVEAMYARLPCVATRVGGVAELLADDVGLLVDASSPRELGAALSQLAGDAERRQQMGEAGRRRAADYSVEKMVAKIEALYEEVLAEKGLGR
jgi:glycosyltransferase involved in cell wall biosynthesis